MPEYIKRMSAMTICERYIQHCFATDDDRGQDIADRIFDEITEIPTADVVEVVRCKDCKHAKLDLMEKGLVVCRRPVLKNGQLLPFNLETKYADFCSYGELKEREGK